MTIKKDCNNHVQHYHISDSDFVLNYTPYVQDEYNGRCYFLDYSNNFNGQVAREGGLVRRRISKASYEAALAEVKSILSDSPSVPAIDKEDVFENATAADREDGTIPQPSADDMIADFDAELRQQITSPHYPTVNVETAKHELYDFLVALKELEIIGDEKCWVLKNFSACMHEANQVERNVSREQAILTPELQTALQNIHNISELERLIHFWWIANKHQVCDTLMEQVLWAMHRHFLLDRQII